jgi:hypothetical protein
MVTERVHRDLAAVHHAEDSPRDTGLLEEFRGTHYGQRHARRGLQHVRVPGRDCERSRQQPREEWEIERRDPSNDPDRLSEERRVDAAAHLLKRPAHHECGHAGRELDLIDAPPHFRTALRERLAVLQRDGLRQFLEVLFAERL